MIDAKEKTALATSVGADERQSFQTSSASIIPTSDTEINHPDENSSENLEEIYRQMQRMNDPAYLHTVSMNELYETVYQSRPPVIDGLLYSGTYLFAGAPKVGKSFFMAQLAYHISTGQKLWNYDVHQGTVLYLALEDDYQRLQERMSRMFGVEGTDSLHFAVYAKQLGAGLDEQLEKFIRDHPDTRLIIIDTLQKIREVSTDAYSYANDYDIVGRMKQFADKNGVCLLLVHHTRKQQAGDKFEMISGTTGLLGCADGAFLLQKEKRTDLSATLEIAGRDQPDQILSCAFNMDTACVELKFDDGSMIAIDTIAVENEVTDNMYQRSELDYLIYNDPVAYAELILNGDSEIYLKTVTEYKPLDS